MTKPVRTLEIQTSYLPAPARLTLPWEFFSESMQQTLDQLDTDDSGILTLTPDADLPADRFVEVCHANKTGADFNRLMWRFAGDAPHNHREKDAQTLEGRQTLMQAMQVRIFKGVVSPVLSDKNDIGRWKTAQRLLMLTGDFAHLYQLGTLLIKLAPNFPGREFLDLAWDYLQTAKWMASGNRFGRTHYVDAIDRALVPLRAKLDALDVKKFAEDIQKPYLFASTGTPPTADAQALGQGGEVSLAVAVPEKFLKENGNNPQAVLDFFNKTQQVMLRPSIFRDTQSSERYQLTAKSIQVDAETSNDDLLGETFSYHLQQFRLNRVVFEKEKMTYYRVGFTLDKAPAALKGFALRKFDLLLTEASTRREISGGFVLQEAGQTDSADIFAGDFHVNEEEWSTVKRTVEGLKQLIKDNQMTQAGFVKGRELVERFYESINLQVMAFFDLAQDSYRSGRHRRVFALGDIQDYHNMAVSLEREGFHSSNVSFFLWMIRNFEGVLYAISGNHDHHGYPFPMALHKREFPSAPELLHYNRAHDLVRFGREPNYFDGVGALMPEAYSGFGGVLWRMITEANSKDPHVQINDDFLKSFIQSVALYECYSVSLGNKHRVFLWPTETEHFNYLMALQTEFHDPLRRSIWNAMQTYLARQHVNGIGPRPELIIAFLNELEKAQSRDEMVILAGHYPPFYHYNGDGPDQTPDSEDALRGDVAWAVRLASWFYRDAKNRPVLSLSVGAHVHYPTETRFDFHFDADPKKNAEKEAAFRAELGQIFAARKADTLLEKLHALRHKWDLDGKTVIERSRKTGSDGLPGPIVRDANEGKAGHQTTFITLPPVGPAGSAENGYSLVTTRPDGSLNVQMKYYRVAPDGSIVSRDGRELEDFRADHAAQSQAWDPNRKVAPYVRQTTPTSVVRQNGTSIKPRHFDYLPGITQYPKSKIGLNLDVQLNGGVGSTRSELELGGEILLPLSEEINTTLGGPNDLRLGAAYAWRMGKETPDRVRLRMGADLGVVAPYLTYDFEPGKFFENQSRLGLEAYFHWVLPIPGSGFWISTDSDKNISGGLMMKWSPTILTYRPSLHHKHD